MLKQGLYSFLALGLISAAALSDEARPVDYVRDVKPVLKARCFACHGSLKQEAELRLDTVEFMHKSAVLKAAQPAESPLLARITATDLATRMPPEGMPLTPDEIARIRAWITAGAPGPENEQPEADPRSHWAFQKPVRPAVPAAATSSTAANAVDAFLLAELQQRQLTPRPPATYEHQLRRVSLDLIGLPPTPDELSEALADASPDVWDRVVDRLLSDPRHGERWGRHWMDIWRYSDWYGRREVNDVRNSAGQIWRWRDWIVNSLNADHGYDRMLQEMLAADEIAPEDETAAVATGYLIRNYYSLNPNDWMRAIVEHTGKGFLGLTFNCAHCHDHKYDPITHDNYFQLRAVFEPIHVRQDRVPREADPGKFQEYDYGGMRKIERLGLVRIFDRTPDAPTWFYTGGDERNRVKDRGSITPGVPAFLTGSALNIQPLTLPPRAWYPGLQPELQETVRQDARVAFEQAEQKLIAVRESLTPPDAAAVVAVRVAEQELDAALSAAQEAGTGGALVGRQSLILDATGGRRILQNGLQQLTALPDGSRVEFDVLLLTDAHFNFQFAKDVVTGLTAGYLGFNQGQILAYQPGTYTEFHTGAYDFASGQRRFHVEMTLDTAADRCRLSVRSLTDDKLLVNQVPIALNGWNPVGDAKKAITFDARTGSVAAIDAFRLSPPGDPNTTTTNQPAPLAAFDFESPRYQNGRDLAGIEGWTVHALSQAPATSVISDVGVDPKLRELSQKTALIRRRAALPELRLQAAEAAQQAAQRQLTAVEARLAADRARYSDAKAADMSEPLRTASRAEREAAVQLAEADVLAQQLALTEAEAKPADDAQRKTVDAATAKLAAAKKTLETAQANLANESLAETYTPFTPTYPATSTGRRKAFAEWVTSPDQPLTPRVAVNHIWSWHFHSPLVSSVFDFGRNGTLPTHPELLDWLAVEFRDSGWNMKHLHRLLVTSTAYRRMSSVGHADANVAADPENRFLWRMNGGRMESEVVRDSLLACADRLELTLGGQELENTQALTTYRRSLYYSIYPEGGGKGAMGELFDAPDPLDCYRRTKSVIPQQALALTNSDLIHQMSTVIVSDPQVAALETDAFITAMFQRILSRGPSPAESEICREGLANAADPTAARQSLVRALFNHNDFIAIR